MRGYHARRMFDVRLTEIADRIAGKPRALRDDLLTLALAARYAAGPRETLIKAILRAGGINPQSPYLRSARGVRVFRLAIAEAMSARLVEANKSPWRLT